jgi:hypothetical protein
MAKKDFEHAQRPDRPAMSLKGREDQIIAMAYDEVERRIANGTATGPELVHFLKRGSPKEQLEMELLEKEKSLLDAKVAQINDQKTREEMYVKAIAAMKSYSTSNND